MTLPASGIMSLSQVNTELGHAAGTILSMGDADVRDLFGVPSGIMSMSDGYGKTRSMYSRAVPKYYWVKVYNNIFSGTYVYWNDVEVISGGPEGSPQSAGGYTYTQSMYVEEITIFNATYRYYRVGRT
jgi:hypothetical protein